MKAPDARPPLPQGGEGSKINPPLAPLGERGPLQYIVVKNYTGHHASCQTRIAGNHLPSGRYYLWLLIRSYFKTLYNRLEVR